MASNFLIDGAKSLGQIASDASQNIFNGATKGNTLANGIGNALTVPFTGGASMLGWSPSFATPEMKEEMRRQALSDVSKYGTKSNRIGYEELGLDSYWNKSGEHPKMGAGNGMLSAGTGIAFTGGKMDYKLNPSNNPDEYNLDITGGAKYDFPANTFGNNKVSQFISDHVNRMNTEWNPDITIDSSRVQEAQKEYDDLRGNPIDSHITNNQAPPAPIPVEFDSSDYWKAKWAGTPYETTSWTTGGNTGNPAQMNTGAYVPPAAKSFNPKDRFNNLTKSTPLPSNIPHVEEKRRQQGQISKPPLAVVTPQTPQTSSRFDSKGYTPKTPKVPKQAGMMSSGPKRRSSRGSRKKAVAKPSRSNYSRKYSRLVGGR